MEDPIAANDETPVPKTMAEALEWESPADALRRLSESSAAKAESLSQQLALQLAEVSLTLPDVLTQPESMVACSDSISHSLTKIASGGSEASQEIRTLEEEKRELERHAQDVETALGLRQSSQTAADALRRNDLKEAALAVQDYTEQARLKRHTPRALAYAGDSTVQQIQTCEKTLQSTLVERYQAAAEQADLKELGELTPLLSMVQLEKDGVSMYLRYLQETIAQGMAGSRKQASAREPQTADTSVHSNGALSTIVRYPHSVTTYPWLVTVCTRLMAMLLWFSWSTRRLKISHSLLESVCPRQAAAHNRQ